jgi:AcrR family transcriptional regulator
LTYDNRNFDALTGELMPPARNAAATREKLLAAARSRFVLESYDNVSLRDIAGQAGVDVALVIRYFGSKEELFRSVLRKEEGDWRTLELAADDLTNNLADMAICDDSKEAEHIERLLIMLRSAASPQAAAIVSSAFHKDVLQPFAKVVGGPNAEARAAMCLSVLMGTTIVRTIMKLEGAYECDASTFRDRLADLLRAALAPAAAGAGQAADVLQPCERPDT